MSLTFTAKIRRIGVPYAVDVPRDVVKELGGAAMIPVIVRYAGDAHASTVTPGGGGRGRVFLHADALRAAGFKVGDEIAVTITRDPQPRVIEVPADLARALQFRPNAAKEFERAAPSTRRVVIENLVDARTPETRQRRIERLVEQLAERAAKRKPQM
ncbi:MAG TPA: YdeI/OmpD-associated family protein [Opitutaceae bacterium]